MFEDKQLDEILAVIEPLLMDPDRFKQRAGAELLAGLLRGKLVCKVKLSFNLKDLYSRLETLAEKCL